MDGSGCNPAELPVVTMANRQPGPVERSLHRAHAAGTCDAGKKVSQAKMLQCPEQRARQPGNAPAVWKSRAGTAPASAERPDFRTEGHAELVKKLAEASEPARCTTTILRSLEATPMRFAAAAAIPSHAAGETAFFRIGALEPRAVGPGSSSYDQPAARGIPAQRRPAQSRGTRTPGRRCTG